MIDITTTQLRILLLGALVAIIYVGCDSAHPPPTTGGNYPPVTPEQLAGSTTSQRTGQDADPGPGAQGPEGGSDVE